MRQVKTLIFWMIPFTHKSLRLSLFDFQDMSLDDLRNELPERQPRYPPQISCE